MKFLEAIFSLPFMLVGWLLSITYTGFCIGWESGQLGEFKMRSIANLTQLVNQLRDKNETLKKELENEVK